MPCLLRPVIQPVLDRELFANRTWSRGIEGVDLEPVLALARALRRGSATVAGPAPDRTRRAAHARRRGQPRLRGAQPPADGSRSRREACGARAGEAKLTTRRGVARSIELARHRTRTPVAPAATCAAFGPGDRRRHAARGRGSPGCARSSSACARRCAPSATSAAGSCSTSEDGASSRTATARPPVRFLPDYDNALLSHDDRSRIVQPLPWPELRRQRHRAGVPRRRHRRRASGSSRRRPARATRRGSRSGRSWSTPRTRRPRSSRRGGVAGRLSRHGRSQARPSRSSAGSARREPSDRSGAARRRAPATVPTARSSSRDERRAGRQRGRGTRPAARVGGTNAPGPSTSRT